MRDPIKHSQTDSQTTRTDRAKGGGWRKRDRGMRMLSIATIVRHGDFNYP